MTHYYDTLFRYIAEVLVLPESDKTLIRQLVKPIFVARDTIIESAGRVPRYHNFIVSGFDGDVASMSLPVKIDQRHLRSGV